MRHQPSSIPVFYRLSFSGLFLLCLSLLTANMAGAGSSRLSQVEIVEIEPNRAGGYAYRLTYCVDAPIEVFWRFKTDFTSDEIADGRHIRSHQYIGRRGNKVLTETRFAGFPRARFVWKTTVYDDQNRLSFDLVKTDLPGHRFHFGTIQLKSRGAMTEVVQIAYFDFLGAPFWIINPWQGGMRSFLFAIVQWEQAKIIQTMERYRK